MCNYSKREAAYRKSIRQLGGNFLATKANSIPHGICVDNLIIISGSFYQGLCGTDNCVALYRTKPLEDWFIYHNSDLSESDYNSIYHALKEIKEKEEKLKEIKPLED